MKNFLAILLLGLSSLVTAQTVQTTPNLITSGTNHTWTGVTTGSIPAGCATAGPCPGGPSPIYDPSTNTISFSYNASAYVGQTIAINNALASVGAGIKINGYNYGYEVRNMNGDDRQSGIDTFTVGTALRGANNSVLLSHNQYFNTKFDWTAYSGTRTAAATINPADATYLQIGITGGDNGYWGGYFGPQVRNVNMSLNYSVDPCATNPAYSPTCANYGTVSTQSLFSGVSGPQAYAINQALSGSGVMVHGFDYGYNYSVGGVFCNWMDFLGGCLGTWVYPSASMTTKVTDNNNTVIFTETNTHSAGAVGAFNKQLRFGASRSISTMGSFSMTPSTYNGAQITNMYGSVVYTADPCVTDPLSSQSCPGYAAAYLTQQCTANPLYDSACPGYAQALFTQQCNTNQLSYPSCPGYAQAYLTYQCSVNPLYSTTCAGYETAYFNQQCTADPLYNSRCSGYATAYHDQQCSLDPLYATTCTGYSTAYHNQQCGLNPLYATTCTGYSTAYFNQQCTANPLYNSTCPGYDQAYLNARCIQDSLYSTQCEGYKTAYAIKYLVGLDSAVTTSVNASLTNTVETQRNDPTNTTGTVDAVAAATSTSSTNQTATTSATSISPVAVISTVKPAPAPVATMAQAEPKQEKKAEEKKEEGAKKNDNGPNSASPSSDTKPNSQPKTNREAVAERRREAAQKEAVAKGKDLANEMGKAADMEAQKAVQNVVIQAMGFTPGFDAYNKAMIPDTTFYKPYTVYGNQKVIDNRALSRGLTGGSDRAHQEMVDSQYNRGN